MKSNFALLFSLFLFIVFSQLNLNAQLLSIKGKIEDKETGSRLPYANIRVVESLTGSSSNSSGEFELKIPAGKYKLIASYIGYITDTLNLELNQNILDIIIRLRPTDIELPEIVIKPGENPALEIIRKAIERKKERELQINNYEFESFAKGTIKTTEFVTASTSAISLSIGETDTSQLKVTGVLESHSKGYFAKPKYYKEIILARKQSANFPPAVNILTGGRLVQNFYGDEISFFGRNLPGILSDNALEYYYFYIEKFQAINQDKVYQIHIEPNDPLDPGFTGKIFIIENTYDLLRVELLLNKAANIGGLFDSVEIIQHFDKFDDIMMPVDYRLSIKANFLGLARFGFDLNSILFNYKINSLIDFNVFSKAVISVLPDADKKNSEYWNSIQTIPNTIEEIEAFKIIDSLQNIPKNFWDEFSLLNSRISLTDKFLISAPIAMYHFNRVEGHTIDFGIFANKLLDNRFNSKLFFNYGFSDKKFKQELTTSLLLGDYRTTQIYFNLFNTKRNLFKKQEGISEFYNSITALFLKDDDEDYFYQKGFELELQTELSSVIKTKLSFLNKVDISAIKNSDFSIFRRNKTFKENPPIEEGRINLFGILLTFDSRDFIEDGYFRRRTSFGKNFSIISVGFKYSNDKILGSDFSYKQFEFSYQTSLRTFSFSFLNIRLFGGISDGNIPIQQMFALPGSSSYLSTSNAFRTLRTNEVFGDRIFYLNIEQDFRDELFRALKLSFLNKWDLYLNSFFNVGWSKSKSNFLSSSYHDIKNLKNPLFELGFGLRKGFIPLELEFAWKLTNRELGKNFRISLNSAINL